MEDRDELAEGAGRTGARALVVRARQHPAPGEPVDRECDEHEERERRDPSEDLFHKAETRASAHRLPDRDRFGAGP
ncbi:hypothetical protein Slu03_28570 [Sediminihabitans luteus]|nr:hypothetical protein Slu03_28570 [Sediminihabitans luteus]